MKAYIGDYEPPAITEARRSVTFQVGRLLRYRRRPYFHNSGYIRVASRLLNAIKEL